MSSVHFKCNSCLIQFLDSDAQRYHMKTDWHRYNLKRRVAGLTPVDAAIFAEKVKQSQQYEEEVDEFGFKVLPQINNDAKKSNHHQKQNLHIQQVRGRHVVGETDHQRDISPASTVASGLSHFSLGESVYSHAGTHSDLDSNFETASEADTHSNFEDFEELNNESDFIDEHHEFSDEDYESSIQPITSCIFCGIPHNDLEVNVTHMFKAHGLYLPERSYLTDLKGLLDCLISVIVVEHECLCCNFKGRTLESIRAHVTSKGHCRLPYETKQDKALLAQFYDFSSIGTEVKPSKSKKKVGFTEDNDVTIVDGISEDESEDDESEDDVGINDNYTLARVDPIDSQLTLPNGQRLGHRSLQRYYRQNISVPTDPSQGQLTVHNADRRLADNLALQQQKKEDKTIQLVESRLKSKKVVRDVRRGNFQTHYRDPLLQ